MLEFSSPCVRQQAEGAQDQGMTEQSPSGEKRRQKKENKMNRLRKQGRVTWKEYMDAFQMGGDE